MPARHDRNRARLQSAAAHRRRAHHGAGCHYAGRDPVAHRGARARAQDGDDPHHARPRHGVRILRPDRRHACRPCHRDFAYRRALQPAAPSLHRASHRIDADAGAEHRHTRLHARQPAGSAAQRPAELPIPRPLRPGAGGLCVRLLAYKRISTGPFRALLQSAMNVLDCVEVKKHFPVGKGALLHAVDDVSFGIGEGESVGLVGESGCGKSTLVRLVTRMLDPTDGDIIYRGRNIGFIPARRFASTQFRPKIQMVFQDPTDSLNPRHTAFDAIAEPVRRLGSVKDLGRLVAEAARMVALPEELLPRYPHELSGGQKARVGIARAIVMMPDLLVLDEPTAALDVSVQATILRLLAELKRELGMSYLFVSHDLNVVRMLCDRVIVMYLGKVVEQGPAGELFRRPAHPYTRALLSAIPLIGGRPAEREGLAGEPRSPINPDPLVCRFYGRCPQQRDRCRTEAPQLREVRSGVVAACHFA